MSRLRLYRLLALLLSLTVVCLAFGPSVPPRYSRIRRDVEQVSPANDTSVESAPAGGASNAGVASSTGTPARTAQARPSTPVRTEPPVQAQAPGVAEPPAETPSLAQAQPLTGAQPPTETQTPAQTPPQPETQVPVPTQPQPDSQAPVPAGSGTTVPVEPQPPGASASAGQATASEPAQSTGSAAPPATGATVSFRADLESAMVDLVNAERAKVGLPALVVDPELTRLARLKSADIVNLGYFSHTSPTYGSPFDMMRAAGVSFAYAGENLAEASTLQLAFDGLMQSPGHRENILRKEFTRIGIGVAEGGPYGLVFTQLFTGD